MRNLLINGGPCRDRTYDQLIKRDFSQQLGRAFSRAYGRLSLSVMQKAARFAAVCYRGLEGFLHKEVDVLKIALLTSVLAVSGCATCQQHPVACAIGGGIIIGSAAAIIEHHHDEMHDRQIAPSRGPQ